MRLLVIALDLEFERLAVQIVLCCARRRGAADTTVSSRRRRIVSDGEAVNCDGKSSALERFLLVIHFTEECGTPSQNGLPAGDPNFRRNILDDDVVAGAIGTGDLELHHSRGGLLFRTAGNKPRENAGKKEKDGTVERATRHMGSIESQGPGE